MINGNPIHNLLKGLTLTSQSKDALSVKAGTVLEAKVIEVTKEGNPLLKVLLPGAGKESTFETLIKNNPGIPFAKGQTVIVEVLSGRKNINAKILNILAAKQDVPETLQKMLSGKGTDEGPRILLNALKAVTANIKSEAHKGPVTLVSISDKAVPLQAGTIIKAKVTGVTQDGKTVISLKIPSGTKGDDAKLLTTPEIKKGKLEQMIIKSDRDLSLKKGENIFLKITGGRKNIKAEIIESFRTPSGVQQDVPVKFLEMLANSSESKLTNSELKLFLSIIKSFPTQVKASIPGIKVLEKSLHDIKQLNSKTLKALIKTSGVAFETRLKAAIMKGPGQVSRNLAAFESEGDLKGVILRLKAMLNNRNIVNELEKSGIKAAEVSELAERFINNIEFFQVTSKINDMFYTFLPIFFNGFRDAEFLFKKSSKNGKEASTYDINLDLENLGKISISVTILDKVFHVSFFTELEGVKKLINSQMHQLKSRFSSQGLQLKTIHVNHKKNIVFGQSQYQGVSFRV